MKLAAGDHWSRVVPCVIAALELISQPAGAAASPDALIDQAFTYAFPVYEMMRVRWSYVDDPASPARTGVNGIAHGRTLIDHTRRVVTTPNNDPLYSRTILDLSVGPVAIHVPDTNGRYYSLAFYDVFSNGFAYVGGRLPRTRGGGHPVGGPRPAHKR